MEGALTRLGSKNSEGVSARVFLGQVFGDLNQVANETVDESLGHILANDYAKNLDLFYIRREIVVGDDPAFDAEESLDPLLLDVRVLLFEVVVETEGDDWKTSVVVFNVGFVHTDGLFDRARTLDESMNIRENVKVSAAFESTAKKTSIFEIVDGDVAITFKAKMDEVEVLGDDRSGGTGKVERERVFDRT